MSDKKSETKAGDWRARLAALLLAGVVGMLAPAVASARGDGEDFHIQVFALSGPACGGPVIFGDECPDVLLPGAELVLQRLNRRLDAWEDVAHFRTNRSGYANLLVKRRGIYRVEIPEDDSIGIRPAPLPFFEGPVQFRVPARHEAANGFQVTPAVVSFDSGIR
jgi:hypothetical protein